MEINGKVVSIYGVRFSYGYGGFFLPPNSSGYSRSAYVEMKLCSLSNGVEGNNKVRLSIHLCFLNSKLQLMLNAAANSSLVLGSNAKTPPKKATVGQIKPLEAPGSFIK
ncbi:uncharacterized protein [Rutidosis leptorrhynchoides]|uniref:uncharacterized protein isoform X2 n=1 Tax=Rutidosis leptorrhynchoides TaxID=125765 RepID=UPI003A9A3C35